MCQSGRTTGGIRTIPIYGGPNLRRHSLGGPRARCNGDGHVPLTSRPHQQSGRRNAWPAGAQNRLRLGGFTGCPRDGCVGTAVLLHGFGATLERSRRLSYPMTRLW